MRNHTSAETSLYPHPPCRSVETCKKVSSPDTPSYSNLTLDTLLSSTAFRSAVPLDKFPGKTSTGSPISSQRMNRTGNVDAIAREEHDPLTSMHYNKCPKGQVHRTMRSGAIATFAILTPLTRGVKSRAELARMGSFQLTNISTIDIRGIYIVTHL